MKESTHTSLIERKEYICKKLGIRYSHKWYMHLVKAIEQCGIDFYEGIGYCGEGDDSCKKETLSSKLIPDPKVINWTCWFHDRLYEQVKLGILTYEMADKILKYSGYYEANNLKGFDKVKAVAITRLYYRGVWFRTLFSGLFS